MSDTSKQNSNSQVQTSAPAASSGSSISRILVTVAVLAVIIVAGGYWWAVGGGEEFIGSLTRPAFVQARATVTWNGKPVERAMVLAEPLSGSSRNAMGFSKEDGTVVFQTDTGGQYSDGIDVGKYKLTVAARGEPRGPAPPELKTPAKYASAETTDLFITVTADEAANDFPLVLEGEAPEQGGGPSGSGGPPGGGPRQGPPPGTFSRPDADAGEPQPTDAAEDSDSAPEGSSEEEGPPADEDNAPATE